jgi:hypothetical protein
MNSVLSEPVVAAARFPVSGKEQAMEKQLIAVCLLVCVVALGGIGQADATAPDTRLRLEPADLVVGPNETFVVRVMIEEANDLGGFQFDLTYDASVVEVQEAALGDFLGSTGRSPVAVGPEVSNEEGRTTFGAVSYGNQPGPSGTGVLATITCIARGEGSSGLSLQEVQVLDTAASVQLITVKSGRVVVGGEPGQTPVAETATPTPDWVAPVLAAAALTVVCLAVFVLRRRSGDLSKKGTDDETDPL